MNFAEMIISIKLKEVDPTLDIVGSDRKLLQVACQDLANYLEFNSTNTGKETNNLDLSMKIEQLYRKNPVELESFLKVWIGLWLKKWKERVKLLIGQQNRDKLSKVSKKLANAEYQWQKLACKEELIGIVKSMLIRNAEICGTEILAEYLVKMELSKRVDSDINSKEEVLDILNNTLRKSREMVQIVGPLISIKIDKNYFCLLRN